MPSTQPLPLRDLMKVAESIAARRGDGRSEWIRTTGPRLPKTVLYQAELHSDPRQRRRASIALSAASGKRRKRLIAVRRRGRKERYRRPPLASSLTGSSTRPSALATAGQYPRALTARLYRHRAPVAPRSRRQRRNSRRPDFLRREKPARTGQTAGAGASAPASRSTGRATRRKVTAPPPDCPAGRGRAQHLPSYRHAPAPAAAPAYGQPPEGQPAESRERRFHVVLLADGNAAGAHHQLVFGSGGASPARTRASSSGTIPRSETTQPRPASNAESSARLAS